MRGGPGGRGFGGPRGGPGFGGPRFGGPGFGGPGFGGPPGGGCPCCCCFGPPGNPMERVCAFIFPCFWIFGPPPPPPHYNPVPNYSNQVPVIVVNNSPNNVASYGTENTVSSPIPSESKAYREINTTDYVAGRDIPSKYYIQVPIDAIPSSLLKCNLGGIEKTVKLPSHVIPGETLIVCTASTVANAL